MDSTALWIAVDRLVEPTRVKLDREAVDAEPWDIGGVLCNVAAYRAATATRGLIPSLWDQASNAVSGGDTDGRGALPARERSIADWDLLEHRQAIIETVRWMSHDYGDKPIPHIQGRPAPFQARTEIRHLASLIIAAQDPNIGFHTARVEQWGRIMARLLNQLDEPAVKRVRVCCVECGARRPYENRNPEARYPDDQVNDWPVRISYSRLDDGSVRVRGAECDACGVWWWPDQLADAYQGRISA